MAATNDLTYRFNNGILNQLTQRLEAYRTFSRVRYNALYVQDQLTRGRLTMTGAVRYDHSWSYYPEQSIGGPACASARAVHWAESKGVIGYNDITRAPAWRLRSLRQRQDGGESQCRQDLRGGRQRQRQLLALLPSSRIDLTQARTWTDANGNSPRIATC